MKDLKKLKVGVEVVDLRYVLRRRYKLLEVSEAIQLEHTKESVLIDIVLFKLKKKMEFSDSVRLVIDMIVIIGIHLYEITPKLAFNFHRFGLFV